MNYTLVSGFYRYSPAADWFLKLWLANAAKLKPRPAKTVIISVGDSMATAGVGDDELTSLVCDADISWLCLQGNLGHVHQLIGKKEPAKRVEYCGWSAAVLTGAMIAYTNETDFVYMEQDALAFGPVIERMYSELKNYKMIFGKTKLMGAAQSLFLVKHSYIPHFVRFYISIGKDSVDWLPERKFIRLMEWFPTLVTQHSIPYDRDRPINFDEPCWYAQKFTADELIELRKRGLISVDGTTPAGLFTSEA